MDGCLTGKGYDQSQTTIDVNAPRSGKLVTPDNLKGQGLVFVSKRRSRLSDELIYYILLHMMCNIIFYSPTAVTLKYKRRDFFSFVVKTESLCDLDLMTAEKVNGSVHKPKCCPYSTRVITATEMAFLNI